MNDVIPPYPPGGIPTVDEVRPASDPAPAWWPEWAPPFSPETATVTAALAALVILVVLVIVAVRRRSTPTVGDPWIRRLVAMIALAAPFMLGLTFFGSFYAVQELAAARGVHPSWVPPLAIDGILVLFLLVDLLFARMGTPQPLVKNVTRGFILLTLLANGASGWGDPVAVFLHIPAPLALVVMTEVARQALVEEARRTAGKPPFDPIPVMRWVLAPISTFTLWRRMILQDVRSYAVALDQETSRRDALAILDTLPTNEVPGYLSRRLRVGMAIPDTVARVHTLAGVHTPAPVAGPPTGGVDGVDTGQRAPATPGVDTHNEPTHPPTPAPDGGVDENLNHVGHDVDQAAPGPVSDVSHTPAPGVRPTPAHTTGVDQVQADPTGPADGVDVHTGTGWRYPGVHTDQVQAPLTGVVPAPAHEQTTAPVTTTDSDHNQDDPDPDPDGGGGGVSTPEPVDVLPGQTTITDALDASPAPGVLDVARAGMDAPVWDDLDTRATKKQQVMALLWEHRGDVTAVRAAYHDRTGNEVPRELYRQGPRGYAWSWHHQVTSYLISEYGHADTVRAALTAAGVDHSHEAVTAALDEWENTHGDHVLQFRRPTPTGS